MQQTIQIFNQVLPILFLISLGYWTRQKQFLSESTVDELRKIVVNLALPAVLFTSFLHIELKSAYFVIFALTFVLAGLLFMLGRFLKKRLAIRFAYFPFLLTGFEYGMLGVSLFGAAYGLEQIGYIAVADLGHEIFIWFVFLPLLLIQRDGAQKPADIAGPEFPLNTSQQIVKALVAFAASDACAQSICSDSFYNWTGLEAASDSFYDPVRDLMTIMGMTEQDVLGN